MINGVQIDNIVFLTESFAKKKTNKQKNEHKQNQQSKPARKKNKQTIPTSFRYHDIRNIWGGIKMNETLN